TRELTADAAAIARTLRLQGHAGEAFEYLTERRARYTRASRDALADSLVAVALYYDGDDIESGKRRHAAVRALIDAGSMDSGGSVYPGAGERLFHIARQPKEIASLAIVVLPRLANRQQAINYLRAIAVSDSKLAFGAVERLGNDLGSERLAVLRQLHRDNLIRQSHARQSLQMFANIHGWPAPL
ncbi:MAG: hypothetical protein ACT4OZ_18110, partial [Gemmatimonadota bacterium]